MIRPGVWWEELRREKLQAALAALALSVALLAAALAIVATAPRPYVLVPAASMPDAALPGDVPDASAADFARLYVLTLDNYTPATIEAATSALKLRVAARRWSEISDALDRRVRVVVEGRMASQVLAAEATEIVRPGDGTLDVRLTATRRIFIADRLSKTDRVRYRVVLEPVAPTAAHPNGLAVVAHSTEELDEAR